MDKPIGDKIQIAIPVDSVNWLELAKKLIADQASHPDAPEKVLPELLFESCKGQSGVAGGWNAINTIVFDGDLGDYCLSHFRGADVEVRGNIANGASQSLQSGTIIVRGHAGDSLAAYGTGGMVAVYGNAGRRAAVALDGADVLVRGSVGSQAAYKMISGSLIIGGTAGPELGKGMTGGVIYIRGEPESLDSHLKEVRMREADRMRIGMILLKAGIKSTGREFRVFRPNE